MATRSTPTTTARCPLVALAALLAAALLAAAAPVPVLGPGSGAACTVGGTDCGG